MAKFNRFTYGNKKHPKKSPRARNQNFFFASQEALMQAKKAFQKTIDIMNSPEFGQALKNGCNRATSRINTLLAKMDFNLLRNPYNRSK